jgi:Domain of unknown function (DUF6487)
MARSETKKKCASCDGTMEEGFLLDRRRAISAYAGEWVAGAPEKKLLPGRVKFLDKRRLAVSAWRCTKCGALQLVAGPSAE